MNAVVRADDPSAATHEERTLSLLISSSEGLLPTPISSFHDTPVKANDGDEVVVDEVIEQLLPKVISAISEKDEANILAEEAEASRDVL